MAGGDEVENLFHVRGELVIDERGEVLLEQADHRESSKARNQGRALLPDVTAIDDGRHDRCVSRRATDAKLLEPGYQRRLSEACRRSRVVTRGAERVGVHDLTFGHIRQLALALIVVEALLGDVLECGEETGEHDDCARCAELGVLAVGRGSADLDGGGRDLCVDHLRGDSALPDQLVQRELVSVKFLRHLAGRAEHIAGRTNSLMCLLRILDLAVVTARNL